MAYMPLDKSKLYLDRTKMTKIYDLSNPWGVDTPLWPFPGARQDLLFPAASISDGSTREP
jgi:hypothetical protein